MNWGAISVVLGLVALAMQTPPIVGVVLVVAGAVLMWKS